MVNSNDEYFNSIVGTNNEVEPAPTGGAEQENESGVAGGGFDPTDYVEGPLGDVLSGPIFLYEKLLQAGQGAVGIVDDIVQGFETGEYVSGIPQSLAGQNILLQVAKAKAENKRNTYENYVVDMVKKGASEKLIKEQDPTNTVKMEKLTDWFEKTLPAPAVDSETGEVLDYISLYGRGEIIKGTDALIGDIAGSFPSLLISRVPVVGPAILGASTYMGEFESELIKRAKDPNFNLEEDRDNLVQNALITGAADFVWETVGGSMLNKIPGMKLGKEKVVDIIKESPKQLLKKAGLGFLSEFTTEGATGVTTELADVLSFGDDVKPIKDYFRTFFKDGFIGGFLGASSSGASGLSAQNKEVIHEYVSPQTYKQDQFKLSTEILTLEQDKQKAKGKDVEYFETKIQELRDKKKANKENLNNFFNSLTKEQKVEYASNIDKQNDAINIIGNKDYSKEAQEMASKDLAKYTEANNKFFKDTEVNYIADFENYAKRTISNAAKLRKARGVFGFDNKNLNLVELNTAEEIKEVNDRLPGFNEADGLFLGEDASGKPTMYINKKVAAETGATNVLGHEYLHAITSMAFKESGIGNENLGKAAKAFTEYLKSTGNSQVVEDIEERLAENYGGLDADGNIIRDENGLVKTSKKEQQEEYFNLFSDLISKEKIKNVEEKSGGIKNAFRQLLVGLGFSKVDFQDGQQVFDYLVDYNANMERAGILGKFVSKRIAKTKMKGLEATAAEKAVMDLIEKQSKSGYNKTERDNRLDAIGEKSTKAEWDAGGADQAISDMYMSGDLEAIVRNNLSSDLKNLPNYSEEDFISETIGELMPHIKNFNIDRKETQSGFGLSGWIRGQISNKIGNVLKKKKATTETFTVDTTDEKVKETVESTDDLQDLQEEDLSIAAQTKKKAKAERREEKGMEEGVEYSTFRRALKVKGKQGLSDNIVDNVKQAVVKTMATERTTPDSDKFIANIKKSFLTELKKPIQDMMGKKDDFTNFLKTNREAIIAALPTSTLVQMERNVDPADRVFTVEVKRNLNPTETDEAIANNLLPKDTNRNSGPTLYNKRMPSEGEFLRYFSPPLYVPSKKDPNKSVRSGLKGTRKDTLAEQMGIELAFDATMEVVQSPEVAERRSLVTDNEFAKTEIAELAKAINRGVDVKFSKSKLRAEELTAGMAREVDKLISTYSNDNDSIVVIRDEKGRVTGYESRDTIEKDFVKRNYSKKDTNLIAELAYKLYNSSKYSRLYDIKTRNKIYKQLLKAKKEGKTGVSLQANRIHEQLFITSLGNAINFLNKDIVVNRFIEEGGKGDVYATLGDETVGVEIKMDEADGTSQTVYVGLDKNGEFTFDYINPNKSINGKTSEDNLSEAMRQTLKDTNKILKEQGLEITSKNIEKYGEGKSRIVLDEAQASYLKKTGLKTMALSGAAADADYIMSAYGEKTLPEGFIHVGNKLYRMVTGNKKVDQQSKQIADSMDKDIPVFANKEDASFALIMEMSEFKPRKDGRFNIVFRSAPKIKGKYLVNSDVNLLKKEDMEAFAKAVNEELVRTNNIKASKSRSKAMELGQLTNKDTEAVGMSTFDFDDTLAFTKSGIRLTMPNPSGKPQPKRKAILIAGNAGAGKTTVINQLGLRKQGFKYINQDIALDWLTKNNGLPKDMNDFTREQSDKWRSLQGEAAVAAKNKASKLRGQGDGVVIDGTGAVGVQFEGMARKFKDAGYDVQVVFVESSLETALERNANRSERRLTDATVRNAYEATQKNKKSFKEMVSVFPYSAKGFIEVNTDNMKQGDPLPADLVSKMDAFTKGYIKDRINAEDFALRGADLLAQGAEYDFSEFNKVVDGTPGPLLDKAKERAKKFGNKNMFILTARPAESAGAIREFLKSQGLDIPLENITGLGNSTGDAKAQWMLDKFAEGYNDMYFVDDALPNVKAVKNVLDQLDIKSKVQQAKIKFSKTASQKLNDMIERKKGIDSDEIISSAAARRRGENVNKFQVFVPPTAEDFSGLLYYFAGKGKQGDADLAFMKEFLLDPLSRGERDIAIKKQSLIRGYNELKDKNWKAAAKIKEMAGDTPYTKGTAVRVYLWNQDKTDIPGLSDKEVQQLVDIVKNDPDLIAYADGLRALVGDSEGKYIVPSNDWVVETIAKDLQDATSRVGRKKFLAEFIENADAFFSKDNLNKMEAAYGKDFRESLEDMLYRIKTGQNRPSGTDASTKKWMNWLNNSVGAIMFFNTKSAVLQLMSTVNYLNWSDNNLLLAGKAFANQKQFWSDFSMLWNSDFLKQRRFGLSTDINEAEIANAAAGAKNKATAVLAYLLKKGFLPTQIADSFAISSGGAAFYRNRVNSYVKQGMDQKAAEEKAMTDFREITEENQQSSRPDRISKQQASPLGRVILAFQNTPMQYARIIKKSVADIVAGRGDLKTHVSKIIFYGGVQSLIFGAMQNALFALAFDDEEDDKKLTKTEQEKKQKKRDTQYERTLNTMLDSLLNGSGLTGRVLSTVKNVIFKFLDEKDKGWNSDMGNVAIEAANISPPLGSKLRKMKKAGDVYDWNQKVIDEMDTFDVNNPIWEAGANVIESTTNVPAARAIKKLESIREAFNQNNETWQRIAVAMGWSQWDLGIEGLKRQAVQGTKEYLKKKKKDEKAASKKPTTKKSSSQDAYFNKVVNSRKNEASKVKGGEYRCTALTQDLSQCKNRTDNSSRKCFLHN